MAEVSLDPEYSQGARNFHQMTERCEKSQLEQILGFHHQKKGKLVPTNMTRMSNKILNLNAHFDSKTVLGLFGGWGVELASCLVDSEDGALFDKKS